MEDLLSTEAGLTRAHITKEAMQTSESIKADLVNTMQQHKTNKATQSQRERLLQSLKFPEMNERQNGITPPHDDTFNRIFRHYIDEESPSDKVDVWDHTPSIDEAWESFRTWLQSPDSLFWIQGKPGSGKSTLVKHIISHKTTKELLSQSHSRVKILSHFFWQIGSRWQKNIAGLYSTLAHQLLQDNEALMDEMISEYPFITNKVYFHDWYSLDLERLVLAAIKVEVDRTWLCVFIDGLDEYTSDHEEDLVDRILRLSQHGKVKLCVSSRPEPRLKEQLDRAPNLKLHDLTRVDMKAYAQQELKVFEANGSLSTQLSSKLTKELIWKAQGVFLWLRLAMKSVKSGIRNHDQEDLILSRLRQLPNELEDLYKDMWKRLNQDIPIYRQSAANYFHLVLASSPDLTRITIRGRSMIMSDTPLLLEIGSVAEQDIQQNLLDVSNHTAHDLVQPLCLRTENEIRTRCAGLLEIKPNNIYAEKVVKFVHRTAHDFLTSTEAGKSILSHASLSSSEAMFEMAKAYLCHARWLYQELGNPSELRVFARKLAQQCGDQKFANKLPDLLIVVKKFYEEGILTSEIRSYPKVHFLSILAEFPAFNGFFLERFEKIGVSFADILAELPLALESTIGGHFPCEIVRKLLSCGADPGLVRSRAWKTSFHRLPTAVRTNALWDGITGCYIRRNDHWFRNGDYCAVIETLVTMMELCPDVSNKGLISPCRALDTGDFYSGDGALFLNMNLAKKQVVPIFEVNTSFLLRRILDLLSTSGPVDLAARLREACAPLEDLSPSLRFILDSNFPGVDRSIGYERWFRVIDQQKLQDIVSLSFDTRTIYDHGKRDKDRFKAWYETFQTLTKDPDILQEIDSGEILKVVAEEGLFGPCSLEEAGCTWSDETGEFVPLPK